MPSEDYLMNCRRYSPRANMNRPSVPFPHGKYTLLLNNSCRKPGWYFTLVVVADVVIFRCQQNARAVWAKSLSSVSRKRVETDHGTAYSQIDCGSVRQLHLETTDRDLSCGDVLGNQLRDDSRIPPLGRVHQDCSCHLGCRKDDARGHEPTFQGKAI